MVLSPVLWAQAHPVWFSLCFVVVLVGVFFVFHYYHRLRGKEDQERRYNFLGQVSFVLNYLFVPTLGFVGLTALLLSAAPDFYVGLQTLLTKVDPTLPSIILILVFAFCLVMVRSLPEERRADEQSSFLSPEFVFGLTLLHVGFYGANGIVLINYSALPFAYAKAGWLLVALNATILCQFAYVHHKVSSLRRVVFIHARPDEKINI